MIRAFIGALLEPELLEPVTALHRQITQAIGRQGVRAVDPAKLHVTLEFLGNVEEEDVSRLEAALAEAMAKHSVMKLAVSGVGAFPHLERPATIWLGVSGGETLEALQMDVAIARDGIGTHFDKNEFCPHITLARVSPPSRKVGVAVRPFVDRWREGEIGTMVLREVVLLRSSPEAYEVISRFPLA
jgi:RNA 2',3'-cyclic 3'-phosphodiesterase